MPEISTITAGVGLAQATYKSFQFLKEVAGSDVISAYFWHHGERIEGSEKIEIEIHKDASNEAIWWYSVKPVDDYVFVRIPIIESCTHELVGTIAGEPNPNAMYWRWIAPVLPGRLYGGADPSNIKVDFLVFGYKPKALLKHFAPSK